MHARSLTVGLIALTVFSLLSSYGFAINDEADLAVAAYNVAEGRLTIQEVPGAYYERPGIDWQPRITWKDGEGYIRESRAMAVLSLPTLVILEVWSSLLPLSWAPIAMSSATLAGALSSSSGRARSFALPLGALFFVANATLAPDLDASVWAPPIAIQLTSLSILAAGVAALHATIRARLDDPLLADVSATILVFATPFAFWAASLKYHGMIAGLLCVVLWARLAREERALHVVAYIAAGLAFWVHPRAGGIIAMSLVGCEVVLAIRTLFERRNGRAVALRAALFALAFSFGLMPYLVENAALFGSPWQPGYMVVGPPGDPALGPSQQGIITPGPDPARSMFENVERELSTNVATEDRGGGGLWSAWINASMLSGSSTVQFSVLMIAPIAVLAPLGIWRRRRALGHFEAFLLLHAALTVFFYGSYLATPGSGAYDSRYLHVLYPILAFFAAAAIVHIVRQLSPTERRVLLASTSALVIASVIVISLLPHDFTLQMHLIRRLGLATVLVIAAWALTTLAAFRRSAGGVLRLADPAVLALAVLPAALFLLQFMIHHPPRGIGGVAHFLPSVQRLSNVLDLLWGT